MNVASAVGRSKTEAKPVVDKELARFKCYALLTVSDGVALAAGYLSANLVYLGDLDSDHGLIMLTVLAPIYVFVAALNRAYNAQVLESPRFGIIRSLQAFVSAAAAIVFIAYFLKTGSDFSRGVFAIGAVVSALLLAANRLLFSLLIRKVLGGTPYATVVICDGATYLGCPFDTVVTTEELRFDPATKDPFHFHAFAEAVAHADRVVVACQLERYALWASVLKSMALDGEILTEEDDPLGIIGISLHGTRRTLVVACGPLALPDRIIKRGFDLLVAAAGFVVLAPILLAAAIAIKLESKGPILFKQERIGRDNKIFAVYKFRSMYAHLCDLSASQLTTRNDARVTKVGDFLRRTSIDELPQLLNVLKGDMSIVGPRPHPLSAKAADLLYWDVDPRYRHRHSIKPGLTGLAQIRGFRGNTERTEDLTNRLQADLEYATNWSLWRDIQIIIRTFFILRHQNAF